MNHFRSHMQRLLLQDSGQDLIEYALIAGLLGLASIAALSRLSTNIGTALNTVGSTITSAT